MAMKMKIRGSGFKHTLPAVIPVAGVWVVVLVLSAPVLMVSMMTSGIVPASLHGAVWFFLLTRSPIIALVGIGLAIVTTARVAGPMVHLKRASMMSRAATWIGVWHSDGPINIFGNSRRPLMG